MLQQKVVDKRAQLVKAASLPVKKTSLVKNKKKSFEKMSEMEKLRVLTGACNELEQQNKLLEELIKLLTQ